MLYKGFRLAAVKITTRASTLLDPGGGVKMWLVHTTTIVLSPMVSARALITCTVRQECGIHRVPRIVNTPKVQTRVDKIYLERGQIRTNPGFTSHLCTSQTCHIFEFCFEVAQAAAAHHRTSTRSSTTKTIQQKEQVLNPLLPTVPCAPYSCIPHCYTQQGPGNASDMLSCYCTSSSSNSSRP